MRPAMSCSIIHHNKVFVGEGCGVRVYDQNPQNDGLAFLDLFPFSEPIREFRVTSDQLLVSTASDIYIISGGPYIKTYFVNLLRSGNNNLNSVSKDLNSATTTGQDSPIAQ